jgi:hypothetical protein
MGNELLHPEGLCSNDDNTRCPNQSGSPRFAGEVLRTLPFTAGSVALRCICN